MSQIQAKTQINAMFYRSIRTLETLKRSIAFLLSLRECFNRKLVSIESYQLHLKEMGRLDWKGKFLMSCGAKTLQTALQRYWDEELSSSNTQRQT